MIIVKNNSSDNEKKKNLIELFELNCLKFFKVTKSYHLLLFDILMFLSS